MFALDPPPNVFEIIRNSRLLPLEESARTLIQRNKIVVVSVFGKSIFNLTGYKRAFRLVVDSFGNPSFIQEGKGTFFSKEGKGDSSPGDTLGNRTEGDEVKGSDDIIRGLDKNCGKDGEGFVPRKGEEDGGKDVGDFGGDVVDNLGGLEGFICEEEGIVFLHLEGAYDSKLCLQAGQELHQAIQETGFIPVWANIKSKYCRCLLLMFCISHILILSETDDSLDTSYLHLFKVLEAVRLEIKPALVKRLEQIGDIPKNWILHGRICSPRLLFLFEAESESSVIKLSPETLQKSILKLRQLQLEDEIYHILRKIRIITNISANSLFAIPSEDQYIFLFDKSTQNVKNQDEKLSYLYLDIIQQACTSVRPIGSLPYRSASGLSIRRSFRSEPEAKTYDDSLKQFKDFLLFHIRIAQTTGFDDDSRRVAGYKHFFVIPTFQEWESGFRALSDFFLRPDVSDPSVAEGLLQLQKFINIDSEYLEAQCSNVFPKIYAAYQRGLPEFYSEQLHQARLRYAMNAFLNISRGPGVVPWLNKLADKCDRYWKRGRQQCETKSLFQHSCVNPMHRVATEDNLETISGLQLDSKLPEMKHSTGNRLISYCNCGRRQGSRDEPFTIKEANYSFYQRLAGDCCDRLESYEFAVFNPAQDNTSLSLQEMLQILKNKSIDADGERTSLEPVVPETNSRNLSQVLETELRQENVLGDEVDDASEGSQIEQDDAIEIEEQLAVDEVVKKAEALTIRESSVVLNVNQPVDVEFPGSNHSNIEYLPGMLHSKAPPGLLPIFPSWSLVCVGPSSLYNHSSGLTPKQGFLNGTNFLLPWDVIVKAEAGVIKPVPRFVRGKRPSYGRAKTTPDEFRVKLFLGLEYECHRGHRFFASDFEKIVYVQGGGSMSDLKEAGAKVAGSDMPLYFRCPCKESRDGRTMIAQLIRIHLVTPKAPVNCFIAPKIQPGPNPCPIFSPGNTEPFKLAPSSYWVLRLPFCYVAEEEVYYVQTSDHDLSKSNGKLLKGTFSVKSMTPAETKEWEIFNLS